MTDYKPQQGTLPESWRVVDGSTTAPHSVKEVETAYEQCHSAAYGPHSERCPAYARICDLERERDEWERKSRLMAMEALEQEGRNEILAAENARLREVCRAAKNLADIYYPSSNEEVFRLDELQTALASVHPSPYTDALKTVCPVPPMPGGAKE